MMIGAAVGAVMAVLTNDVTVKTATKYLAPNLVVKATRQHKFDPRDRSHTYVVTIGRPNYLEKRFVKKLIAACEPFPVKKLQFKLEKGEANGR